MNDDRSELRRAFVRLVVDLQRPEELPHVASRALARGIDAPALRELAGLGPSDPREARDLFMLAMAQLGIEPPTRWDAVLSWAHEIVDGTVQPYEGARLIWWHGWERLDRPHELTGFVGLASQWEEDPALRPLYEDEIIALARRLVSPGA